MIQFGEVETWGKKVDDFLKDRYEASLLDQMSPGPLRDELKGNYDPNQETYEEYLRRLSEGAGPRIDLEKGGLANLRTYLKTLKPGSEVNIKRLADEYKVSRRHLPTVLAKEFPELKTLGKEEASRKMQQERLEQRKTQAPEYPTPISKRARGQKTAQYYDVLWPSEEIKQSYIKDFTSKKKATKGYAPEGLSNEALAKKYFGEVNKGTIAKVERINNVMSKQLNLKYSPASDLEASKIKRQRRLDIVQGGKYFGGTDDVPFHHIMPIGGEVDITTKDVSFISKEMNSKLAPYNKKLNDIADAISNNLNEQQPGYLNRVEALNRNAEQIIDKVRKDLPKKYQGYIGFSKLEPVFDEYGTPIRLDAVRVGVDEAKSLAGKTGEGLKLSDLTQKQFREMKSKFAAKPSALQELMSRTGAGVDPMLATKAVAEEGTKMFGKYAGPLLTLIGTPTGLATLTTGLGVDPRSALDRAGVEAELALAPSAIKATEALTGGIKSPAVKATAQRILNLGFSPTTAARAARIASPIGIMSLTGEALYQMGKSQKEYLESLDPEERETVIQEYLSSGA